MSNKVSSQPCSVLTHLFLVYQRYIAQKILQPSLCVQSPARGGRVLWARALLCAACCGLLLLVARLCVRLLTDVALGHAAAGAAQIGTTKGEAQD